MCPAHADLYYLTSAQAAASLGVTRATLYAYASRGQLRSENIPGQPRARRYYREDVERLRDRTESRRDPARAAARSLHWGGPVLESAITLIQDGTVYYRGQDAIALARTSTLEQVARLLWGMEPFSTGDDPLFRQKATLSPSQLRRI